jgi:hypothetical protein
VLIDFIGDELKFELARLPLQRYGQLSAKSKPLLPARFLPPEDYVVVRVETGKEAASCAGMTWASCEAR